MGSSSTRSAASRSSAACVEPPCSGRPRHAVGHARRRRPETGSPAATRARTRATASASSTRAPAVAPATTTVISPRTCRRRPRGQLAEAAADDLLVGLGQFAAHRPRTVGAEASRRVGQEVGQPVRRLEEHHRALLARRGRPAAGAARRPCGAGTPRSRTGRWAAPTRASAVSTADGPGTAVTAEPLGDGGLHHAETRVGHRRHAGVRGHDDPLAGAQGVQQDAAPGTPRCRRSRTPPAP